jgi:CPA2 family monovalent cation:H+ antiporter-2
VIVLLKPAVLALIVRAFGHAASTALMTGLLLAQVGELSFVLAKLGVDRRFIGEELYGLVLGGALVSILINPVLVRYGALLARRLSRVPPATAAERSDLAGHVIICGCGRVGSELVAELRSRELPYVVIELNAIRVEELRRSGEPCLFGDANNIHILTAAGIERARLLAITHYDAAMSGPTIRKVLEIQPSLRIIARAHRPADVERLRSAGASEVVMPEFEAGMEFLRWTLGHLGLSAGEVDAVIQRRRIATKPGESVQ